METVLGIFCKQPIPGKVKTRLAADVGAEPAARLYEAMLTDIVDRLRGTADERVLCYAAQQPDDRDFFERLGDGDYRVVPQVDGDLGRRLTAFFVDAFWDGPRKVIVIGSDCPTITRARICQAGECLDQREAVIGAASDGGYYLIGLRRPVAGLFDDVDWSTPAVFEQQTGRFFDAGIVPYPLAPIPEVDTIDDLALLREHPLLEQCFHTHRVLDDLDLL